MSKYHPHNLTQAGLLIALGILIPFVTGHAFGVQGTVLLPMHFTVLLAGFLLGPFWGAVIGVLTPLISSVLTGMPPAFPMLPLMIGELGTYGWATGHFWNRGWGLLPALVASMVLGRLVRVLLVSGLFLFNGKALGLLLFVFILQGLPGMVLQLLILPRVLRALGLAQAGKTAPAANTNTNVPTKEQIGENIMKENHTQNQALEALIQSEMHKIVHEGQSIAILQDGQVVFTDTAKGVMPLLKVLRAQPELLKGAVAVDKIVGKAAAMLFTLGGVKEVHTYIISTAGKEYLEKHHIPVFFQTEIAMIENRMKTGICPFEKSVMDTEDPAEAQQLLAATAARLMSGKRPAAPQEQIQAEAK